MSAYQKIPLDVNRTAMQNFTGVASLLAVYSSENAAVSSVITLTQDTSSIEISAVGGPAVMRWVRNDSGSGAPTSVVSAASGANFDHVIPSGDVKKFVVPNDQSLPPVQAGSVQGTNRQYGLMRRVAYKSVGVASIMVNEFGI